MRSFVNIFLFALGLTFSLAAVSALLFKIFAIFEVNILNVTLQITSLAACFIAAFFSYTYTYENFGKIKKVLLLTIDITAHTSYSYLNAMVQDLVAFTSESISLALETFSSQRSLELCYSFSMQHAHQDYEFVTIKKIKRRIKQQNQ